MEPSSVEKKSNLLHIYKSEWKPSPLFGCLSFACETMGTETSSHWYTSLIDPNYRHINNIHESQMGVNNIHSSTFLELG